ncbi:AtpZ/AtpI family protein [Microbulbifer bruguierae]|uniref:AtpZ/AtpI family protein n=1 Tax=Microbulbifer bruguierae TaxID=3029061 RepID=A0ABY8NDY8_9GAMM|nr:AtpZ/AtpI family protein [Microbulbifer bruguierae]WGL17123.1 AtpZ/AtpI family protein [Microbulbifer bruguierae]
MATDPDQKQRDLKQRNQKLSERVERQAKRMKQAERERETLLAQTIYIGTLGLVFVLPVVGGAYLGRWLDGLVEGYSTRWTLSLIFLGVVVGAVNVYLLIRE